MSTATDAIQSAESGDRPPTSTDASMSMSGMPSVGEQQQKSEASQHALQDLSNTYNAQHHEPQQPQLHQEDNGAANAWQKSGSGGAGVPGYAPMSIDMTATPNAAAAAAAYGRVPLMHYSMDPAAYHAGAAASASVAPGGAFQPVYQFGYSPAAPQGGAAAMYNAVADVYHQQQNPMAYAAQMTYNPGAPPPGAYVRPPPGGQQPAHYMQGAYASNSDTSKGPISLFDNATENYTAKWVSSTASIPPDLKASPDRNSNPNSPVREFQASTWSASQSTSNQSHAPLQHTASMDEFAAGASATSGFSPPPSDSTALEQHMNALTLSAANAYNAQPNFASYYAVTHPGQGMPGGHPQQQHQQMGAPQMPSYFNSPLVQQQQQQQVPMKTGASFYGQEYPQMGGSSTAGSNTTMGGGGAPGGPMPGQQPAGGGSTWADMVKKNGNVSEGVTRICVAQQQPPQQVNMQQQQQHGGPQHDDQGGNRFGRPGGRFGGSQGGGGGQYRGNPGGYYTGGNYPSSSPNGGGRFRGGGRGFNGSAPQGYGKVSSPKYGGMATGGSAEGAGAESDRDVMGNGYNAGANAHNYEVYSHTGAASSPSTTQQYSNYSGIGGYVAQSRPFPTGQWGNQFFVGQAPSYGSRQSPVTMTPPFYGGGPPTVAAPLPAPYPVQFYPPPPPHAFYPPVPTYIVGLPPPPTPQQERFKNTWLDQDQVPALQQFTERELCPQVIAHNNQMLVARQSKFQSFRPGGLVNYNCQSYNPQAAYYPGGGFAPRRRFFGPRPGIQPRGKGGSPLKSPQEKSLQSSNASSSGNTVAAETSDEGINVIIRHRQPRVDAEGRLEGCDEPNTSENQEGPSNASSSPSKPPEDTGGTNTASQSPSGSKDPPDTSTSTSSRELLSQVDDDNARKDNAADAGSAAKSRDEVLLRKAEIVEKPLDAAPAAPIAYAAVVARKASPKQTKADAEPVVTVSPSTATEVKAGV